jgi:nitroreductase
MPAMEFLELVRRRQSDRGYVDRPVPRELVEQCLEAARLAPSACNSQPWRFIAVDDPAVRVPLADCLRDAVMNRFVTTAPVLVAVLTQTPPLVPRLAGYWKGKPYYLLDIGMAAEHFCLQAAELGLGTCILGWFDEDGVRRILSLPRSQRIPLVITLGYPSDATVRPKQRRAAGEVWSWNVR